MPWLTALIAVWFLCAPGTYAQSPELSASAACARSSLEDSASVSNLIFKTYKNVDSGLTCLQVIDHGRVIFRRTNDNDGGFKLGQRAEMRTGVPYIPNGTDLTGVGHPDMIVTQYTGGAHCCLITFVFELEPVFRLLAQINALDAEFSYFADLDHNGHYDYITTDYTFRYWPASFAGSPSAPVILEYRPDQNGGGYHLALDKMKRPPPSPASWRRQLAAGRGSFDDAAWEVNASAGYWNTVLNLIYSGNSDFAWKFVNTTWPKQVSTKAQWEADFCSVLKTSPYYPDLDHPLRRASIACRKAIPSK